MNIPEQIISSEEGKVNVENDDDSSLQWQSSHSIQTLDFNSSRMGTIPREHKFSIKQVKQQIEQLDPVEWFRKINMPKDDYFSYPASLEKAELHRQCWYLQPDDDFLQRCKEDMCTCCKLFLLQLKIISKKLNRQKISPFFMNFYKYLMDEYGIAIPLYFTIIKSQMIILLLQFIIYGLFLLIEVQKICKNDPHLQCRDQHYSRCNACQFDYLGIIDIDNFQDKMKEQRVKLILFQVLGYVFFLVNLIQPFIQLSIVRYYEFKYWEKEPSHRYIEQKKSLYVKHLPYKMTIPQIQEAIFKALQKTKDPKKSMLFTEASCIEEVVYLYDIHEIMLMNQKRMELFNGLLITAQQLKELNEDQKIVTFTIAQKKIYKKFDQNYLENTFRDQMKELAHQTSRIKQYLKNGLPFTNKVILKFRTQKQCRAVYLHYQKTAWENVQYCYQFKLKMKIRFQVLQKSVRELKLRKKVQEVEVEETERSESFQEPLTQSYANEEESVDCQPCRVHSSDQLKTTLALMQGSYVEKGEEENHKQLRVHRGFPVHEIFWESIGIHTLHRFKIRIKTLLTSIIVCTILMGSFELIYIYQNNPQMKKNKSEGNLTTFQKTIAIIFTMTVTIISSFSTLLQLNQTFLSKRITYSDLDLNITVQLLFQSIIIVTSFPFVMTLFFWDGVNSLVPIYDLWSMSLNRLFFKCLYHSLHIRQSRFWCRKRKTLKNFSPQLYFQGQLNEIMTPAQFPNRQVFFIQNLFFQEEEQLSPFLLELLALR